jgi:predicted RND superfamily exporter protein
VEAWRPPEALRVLTADDLPRQIREAFTEVDGQRGRLVGFDADHATYYDWNGHDLLRMSDALTVDAVGKQWTAASAATIFAGMLETIIADGPKVTTLALIGVALLALFAFGPRGALPVLGSLGIGILWLGGLLGKLDLKINFMNFVALPITLGVGADYAANIWARMRQDRGAKMAQVIADTGSAVALCSVTTIIGYSSLLMSHNRALRSFGLLADLGEVTCLAAALVAMPALTTLVRSWRFRE